MSFRFDWPSFSTNFYDQAKQILCGALNKGDKPAVIADDIHVHHLDMGTIPPDLEILEIGDLGTDRFRGIFRLTYAGDASIGLQTKIQANPLRQKPPACAPDILSTPSILFASTPLVVPMTLTLSCLKLKAIVVLVISKLEGVTLVFKNDPLESVSVSSTFDSVSAIQAFVQSEIERQLRELFRTELPGIIHQLSRRWIKLQSISPLPPSPSAPSPSAVPSGSPSSGSVSQQTTSPLHASLDQSLVNQPTASSVPDCVEAYDPTYGLRPSHPPLVGPFTRYKSLVAKKSRYQSLSAVLESSESDSEPEPTSTPLSLHPPLPTQSPHTPTRLTPKPRILRSHSALLSTHTPSSTSDVRSIRRVLSNESQAYTEDGNHDDAHETEHAMLRHRRLERFSPCTTPNPSSVFSTPTSKTTSWPSMLSRSTTSRSCPTSASLHYTPTTTSHSRSSLFSSSSSPSLTHLIPTTPPSSYPHSCSHDDYDDEDLSTTATSSNHCHLLASLSRTNCTLSPFTRSIDHVASRSTPPLMGINFVSGRSHGGLPHQKDKQHYQFDAGRPSSSTGVGFGWQKRITKIGGKRRD